MKREPFLPVFDENSYDLLRGVRKSLGLIKCTYIFFFTFSKLSLININVSTFSKGNMNYVIQNPLLRLHDFFLPSIQF